jgi:hypothetical protein
MPTMSEINYMRNPPIAFRLAAYCRQFFQPFLVPTQQEPEINEQLAEGPPERI